MQTFSHSLSLQDTTVKIVVERLKTLIPDYKFSILHIHDISGTLQSKGFDLMPYKIIEFCRAPAAQAVLKKDPDIGLFLPCKVLVYRKEDDVIVTIFLPSAITTFFPNADLGELPKSIEEDIENMIAKIVE